MEVASLLKTDVGFQVTKHRGLKKHNKTNLAKIRSWRASTSKPSVEVANLFRNDVGFQAMKQGG